MEIDMPSNSATSSFDESVYASRKAIDLLQIGL